MKKTALFALAGVICLSITACGEKESVSVSKSETTSESSSSIESSVKSVVETKSNGNENTGSKKSTTGNSATEFLKDATIEETVLYDEDNVKITATDLTYSNSSAEISVSIENGSDKDLSFICGSLGYSCNSVNGYMIQDGYMNSDVAAGKSAYETIQISYDELLMYGINELADIEIGIQISDDDYNNIYTGGKQILTSAADTYEYKEDSYRTAITSDAVMNAYNYTIPYFTDEKLLDQDGLEILSAAFVEQNDGETKLFLEVKNTSEQDLCAVTRNISINGLTVCSSNWSSNIINAGKICVITLQLGNMMEKSCYEAYGIDEYGEISLELAIKDTDGNEIGNPATVNIINPKAKTEFDSEGVEVYNSNDIRIIMKGIVESDLNYRDETYVLFVVENNRDDAVVVKYSSGSFSLNNVMVDAYEYSYNYERSASSDLKIELMNSDLEELGISSPDEINDIEFTLEIRDTQYNTIDEPVISVDMNE